MNSQEIQNELKPGEKLLWSGQPQPGIRFRASDIFIIPFSLLWGGGAIFWEYSVLFIMPSGSKTFHDSTPTFSIIFPLFGIPFVLVGLYMIFGRFIVDAKTREQTY